MPIIKSAKKRVKVARKATIRNAKSKRTLKGAVKAFHAALTGKGSDVAESHNQAQSQLDRAVKKGIISKNKAARRKRQLAAAAKAKGADTTTKTAKKAAAKPKTTVKKAAPAKTATKKPAAAKKTTAKK
ncbi:30S ribosomal protein S20 [Candidatus Saccharibacteria bacterium]|nr:MAG: 30S ribosomal protein S20 [Candidatus Saccharibacteria bacterium]